MIDQIIKNETSISEIKNNCNYKCHTIIPAVYFLLDKNKNIVYIGSSLDVYSRLRVHKSNKNIEFKYNHIIPIPSKRTSIRELEKYFIEKYQPKYNIKNNPCKI